jgi:hypothetical protein
MVPDTNGNVSYTDNVLEFSRPDISTLDIFPTLCPSASFLPIAPVDLGPRQNVRSKVGGSGEDDQLQLDANTVIPTARPLPFPGRRLHRQSSQGGCQRP